MKYTPEILKQAVSHCKTFGEVAEYFGFQRNTGAESYLNKLIRTLRIDYSHFKGRTWRKHHDYTFSQITKESFLETLKKDCPLKSCTVRERLIQFGIKAKCCEKCGISEWLGEAAPLELDHINNDHSDNRLENLVILCSNCHSLKTRNSPTQRKSINSCRTCFKKVHSSARFCRKHANEITGDKRRKFSIPFEGLTALVWQMPLIEIAASFSVTEACVRARCKKLNVKCPPMGYWRKRR